jgi:hypothetical protein
MQEDCKEPVMQVSLDVYKLYGAAAEGQQEYFELDLSLNFTSQLRRAFHSLRAMAHNSSLNFSG